MKRTFSNERMKQILHDAKKRIVQAFAELKEKERLVRERAQERMRDNEWRVEQRNGGIGPATS
jgi:hypothetical protein